MTEPCCADAGKPQKQHRENPDCPYAAMGRYSVGDGRTPQMIRDGITVDDWRASQP